ncbi:MAG: hypothetical protein KUF77_01765 [Candidatus Thiodiazotropha sp. (ex Lucina aurantia)]|uniref:Lipoprotein n=1 Tax=Candidatus Thiodiazotropha taylori TaxID=2792791 RepID=A0A9E4NMP6_9GAMM|nr:hypothetical protein [Candidatus Thiodiazotropha sp. (ex Lucina pensylvanica)]MBT3024114.1 hypothetical protein [Candidatus Thiodiazotropha taylori]MBT3049732.1 hypothetical protein [Candidatus Thiodiazotropha sp. (ex Codakia orbicularis)]MBV2101737.1 hypothetical protein [Candidatus Thiodiazotropha sp. (ex Lucina aurantia)]MCW4238082.1 hypothetical protein [Candidatus Thiodiazotropha endolucinida]
MTKIMRVACLQRFKWLALLAIPLISGGCAMAPHDEAMSDQEIVAKRAQERWGLLIEGRVESAYEYLSTGYRQVTPFPHYQKTVKGVGIWKSAEVSEVSCESAEVCTAVVDIRVVIRYPLMKGPVETGNQIKEKWVKDGDGNWGFLPTMN